MINITSSRFFSGQMVLCETLKVISGSSNAGKFSSESGKFHDYDDFETIQYYEKNVRIPFAQKIAIGYLNELVSQIGKHQITG